MSVRRSVYADKLRQFAQFAFGDDAAFEHNGAWEKFFSRRVGPSFGGRVTFEIGCFDASFLRTVAAKNPDVGFVGLDWKAKSLYDGAKRVADLKLKNIALVRARAQDLRQIFASGEVDEIWIFHPDPCDRDVELKNRLISESFLNDVHQALRDSTSTLSLKTDHPGYYQWILALFGLPEPAWFGTHSGTSPHVRADDLMRTSDLPPQSDMLCRHFEVTMNSADYWNDPAAIAQTAHRGFAGEVTLFESRFLKKRQPIYYFEIRKK